MNAVSVLRIILSDAGVRTNEGKMVDNDKICSLLEQEGVEAFDFQHPEGLVIPVGADNGAYDSLLTHSRTEKSGLVFELLVNIGREDCIKAYEEVASNIRGAAEEAYKYMNLPVTEDLPRRPSAEAFVEKLRCLGVYKIDPFEDLVEFLFTNGVLEFHHAIYNEKGGFTFRNKEWNTCIKIVRCEEDFEQPSDQLRAIVTCVREFFCPDSGRN